MIDPPRLHFEDKTIRCQTGVKGSIERGNRFSFEKQLFEIDQQHFLSCEEKPKRNSVVSTTIFFEETAGVGQSFDCGFRNADCGFLNSNKTMKCEDLQFNLSLYADNDLTEDEQAVLDEHLLQCPLCRVKLSEFQALQNNLRILSRPAVPADLVYSVRSAVRGELVFARRQNWFNLSDEWKDWLQFRLMPYTVGTAVSLFMAISFLISLNSTKQSTEKVLETARVNSNRTISVIQPAPPTSDYQLIITNEELAALRTPVSSESPSLNTKGALLLVTKSFTRGQMKDDDITFVADVFSNGLAQITEVVEAPRSSKSLEDLSNALENDPAYAPFVPAGLDNRSDVVRVVFKIQRVDVFEKKPAKKKSPVK